MATVAPVTTYPERGVVSISWSGIASGSTCGIASLVRYPDKTVHFTGTFGTGSVTLQGSNTASAGYLALVDPQGNAITAATGGKIEAILENPYYIKPVVAVSDAGMAVNVKIVGKAG